MDLRTCFCCHPFSLFLLFMFSAIPLAYLAYLEISMDITHMYQYHSSGWLRECSKWDNVSCRFIVSFGEGGLGQIPVPKDHSPSQILDEIPIIKDDDLCKNSSIGLTIDHPRNRVLVAIGDARSFQYSGLAAYELNTWKRLFLTHLSSPGAKKTYAEDVAVDSHGNAYVTDIKGGRIWKVGVDGECMSTIESPLFKSRVWFKNIFTLNGIVYHPNCYLLVIHTMTGNLFKIDLEWRSRVTVVHVTGGPLLYGDGIELLSPTQLVVAGHPFTRLIESKDNWATACVVGKFKGPIHRFPTAATVKDGKVYVNHMLGKKKHVIAEACFT